MICPNCGTDHGDRELKFCPACGSKLEASAPQPSLYDQPYMPNRESTQWSSDSAQYGSSFDDLLDPKKKSASAATGNKTKNTLVAAIIIVAVTVIALVIQAFGGFAWMAEFFGGSPVSLEQLKKEREEQLAAEATQPPTEPVTMPNFLGMHYNDATVFFEGTGCTPMFEYEYSDLYEENCIIEQSIPAGTTLPEGGMVIIKVSKGADVAPEGYNQKVVVCANAGSSYGTLTLYEWKDGQWNSKYSCDATVGKNGISYDYGEGRKRTPQGVFKLGVAMSANSIPNGDWPFYQVTKDTCIVDDTASVYYNTIQSIRSLSSGISYDPIGKTIVNGYSNICIFIEHNGNGFSSEGVVPGRCSVITICGRNSAIKPTAGCVDISASNMNTLLSMLDFNKDPHIEIVAL